MIARLARITYKAARRIVIAIVGFTVLVLGVVMIVTPGPALVAIPLGLAILSLEFAWARYWLAKVRRTISERTSRSQAQAAESHRQTGTGNEDGN
jgi:tellurite resistance protein TerC